MTLSVTFRRAARAELIDATGWYEAQRPNLGAEFVAEVDRCMAIAVERPTSYPVVHANTRRISTRRFPYSIYFRAELTRIVVLAVFHWRRDPAIWRSRA
jgi:plasmid stabilization system protein ParE